MQPISIDAAFATLGMGAQIAELALDGLQAGAAAAAAMTALVPAGVDDVSTQAARAFASEAMQMLELNAAAHDELMRTGEALTEIARLYTDTDVAADDLIRATSMTGGPPAAADQFVSGAADAAPTQSSLVSDATLTTASAENFEPSPPSTLSNAASNAALPESASQSGSAASRGAASSAAGAHSAQSASASASGLSAASQAADGGSVASTPPASGSALAPPQTPPGGTVGSAPPTTPLPGTAPSTPSALSGASTAPAALGSGAASSAPSGAGLGADAGASAGSSPAAGAPSRAWSGGTPLGNALTASAPSSPDAPAAAERAAASVRPRAVPRPDRPTVDSMTSLQSPASKAQAAGDAVAAASCAGESDPLRIAQHLAAALNGAGTGDDVGFFWITAVTTDGNIVVANSYGLAYIPEEVELPDEVAMASADDAISAGERARSATYPVMAVRDWATHHNKKLRAVIGTEEQLANSDPGAAKVVLEPNDIPQSSEITGRSRLEVVDPEAAARLAGTDDACLIDLLPLAPTVDKPPEAKRHILWLGVMKPMMSSSTDRAAAHLQAFYAYAADSKERALHRVHSTADAAARRAGVADWLYWQHVVDLLHRALLSVPSDPILRVSG